MFLKKFIAIITFSFISTTALGSHALPEITDEQTTAVASAMKVLQDRYDQILQDHVREATRADRERIEELQFHESLGGEDREQLIHAQYEGSEDLFTVTLGTLPQLNDLVEKAEENGRRALAREGILSPGQLKRPALITAIAHECGLAQSLVSRVYAMIMGEDPEDLVEVSSPLASAPARDSVDEITELKTIQHFYELIDCYDPPLETNADIVNALTKLSQIPQERVIRYYGELLKVFRLGDKDVLEFKKDS